MLDTGPYKGVRDFYPEDQFIQNYIFETWKRVLRSFGYEEYSASILEPAELYKSKTGEEIVSEQTYTFTDRGDREVTLRPEMTPTIARMVAAKKRELSLPLRWFTIANLFRYENPQKGRLREHWQLNADIFGIGGDSADTEAIELSYRVMRAFKAEDKDFIIRINSRRVLNRLFALFDLDEKKIHKLSKLLDKKAKVSEEEFAKGAEEVLGDESKHFIDLVNSPDKALDKLGRDSLEVAEVLKVCEKLANRGVTNITFDITLMRGFDYYTGIVFEVFDTHPDNNRSLFGGGRYDDLLSIFDSEPIPAVGFGAGDVTMRDFLETRDLLPPYTGNADIAILPMDETYFEEASRVANEIRVFGKNVVVDYSPKKIGDKIKHADKLKAKFIIVLGEHEAETKSYKLKLLATGEEKDVSIESLKLEFDRRKTAR